VRAFTLCYRGVPDTGEIEALNALASSHGARIEWGVHPRFGRAYALVSDGDSAAKETIRAECRALLIDSPVIALAIFPSVPEALPAIRSALVGPGRPGGVSACDPVGNGLVLEWNLDRTSAEVVLGLVDAELRRFNAGRMSELLSPMPLEWWTRIAAEGLRAPEIAPDRVIEELLEVHHVGG
jgi:hypothetical protein